MDSGPLFPVTVIPGTDTSVGVVLRTSYVRTLDPPVEVHVYETYQGSSGRSPLNDKTKCRLLWCGVSSLLEPLILPRLNPKLGNGVSCTIHRDPSRVLVLRSEVATLHPGRPVRPYRSQGVPRTPPSVPSSPGSVLVPRPSCVPCTTIRLWCPPSVPREVQI